MRLVLGAVGRLKDGPERSLLERYRERLDAVGQAAHLGPLILHEIAESRAGSVAARTADEAERLLAKARAADLMIALDERGKAQSSEAFARLLRQHRDDGVGTLALLIGGPDGHGEAVRAAARHVLSLGPMTLPHGLARIVLAEQLYRAATILTGHPYHRG